VLSRDGYAPAATEKLGRVCRVQWWTEVVALAQRATQSPETTQLSGTLHALRDDVDPVWCRRRDAVTPPALHLSGRRFAPTVLEPLPLELATSNRALD